MRDLEFDKFVNRMVYSTGSEVNPMKDYILWQGAKIPRQYSGKYFAVVNKKIVAVGKSRYQVYQRAIKGLDSKTPVGVFYLPRKKELLTAL